MLESVVLMLGEMWYIMRLMNLVDEFDRSKDSVIYY